MRIRNGPIVRRSAPRGLAPKTATSVGQVVKSEIDASSPASKRPPPKVASRLPALNSTQWLISCFVRWTGTRKFWEWIWERAFRSHVPGAPEAGEVRAKMFSVSSLLALSYRHERSHAAYRSFFI